MSDPVYFSRRSKNYAWLSNRHPFDMTIDGKIYHHVEGYFQSQKVSLVDPEYADSIRDIIDPVHAKRSSGKKQFPLAGDALEQWEQIKEGVMLAGLQAKFSNDALRKSLLTTGDCSLREQDSYWGGMRKNSLNRLGELLMQIRAEASPSTT